MNSADEERRVKFRSFRPVPASTLEFTLPDCLPAAVRPSARPAVGKRLTAVLIHDRGPGAAVERRAARLIVRPAHREAACLGASRDAMASGLHDSTRLRHARPYTTLTRRPARPSLGAAASAAGRRSGTRLPRSPPPPWISSRADSACFSLTSQSQVPSASSISVALAATLRPRPRG